MKNPYKDYNKSSNFLCVLRVEPGAFFHDLAEQVK